MNADTKYSIMVIVLLIWMFIKDCIKCFCKCILHPIRFASCLRNIHDNRFEEYLHPSSIGGTFFNDIDRHQYLVDLNIE